MLTPDQIKLREVAERLQRTRKAVDRMKRYDALVDFENHATAAAILELLALVEAEGWRDLATSKPPKGRHVIIALNTGNVVTGFRFSAGWHWDETDCDADAEAIATHWRPLPAPPSKESDHGN